MQLILKYTVLFFVICLITSCEDKPKIIVEDVGDGSGTSASIKSENGGNILPVASTAASDVHQVMTHDVLQAERYTYLQVSESGKKFWIATSKMEAIKGNIYLYRGGLMKTNFESLEFNRTFDTIYLVGNVIEANAHPGGDIGQANLSSNASVSANSGLKSPAQDGSEDVKNAIRLSDLFKNKERYAGNMVTVSGECVKVNNGIMGRNWIHIRDGSKLGEKNLDLTVTSKLSVSIGQKVTLKGKIEINKDFGAGYRYDIIMEDAQF